MFVSSWMSSGMALLRNDCEENGDASGLDFAFTAERAILPLVRHKLNFVLRDTPLLSTATPCAI